MGHRLFVKPYWVVNTRMTMGHKRSLDTFAAEYVHLLKAKINSKKFSARFETDDPQRRSIVSHYVRY